MKNIIVILISLVVANHLFAQTSTITVNGPVGNLYVNDNYTGKRSPATISVPSGQVRIGIGNTTGYYQKTINTTTTNVADLNGLHPLPRRVFRIVLTPARNTSHGGELATLKDIDMELARTTLRRASTEEVLPYSYGLLEWKVYENPMIENITLEREADGGNVPNGRKLLTSANQLNLYDDYDVVFLFYSVITPNNILVKNGPCCYWGGRDMMYLDNGVRFEYQNNKANYFGPGYTHEWLHGIEQRSGIYVEGYLHGAAAHGYDANSNNSHDWMGFYQDFIRSTVPKVPGNTQELTPYVGHFSYLKNFVRDPNKDSDPVVNVSLADGTYTIKAVHSNRYLTVENASKNNGAGITQADYSNEDNQQWILKKVDNGIYSLTAKHSGKSLDVNDNGTFNGDSLIQWDYTGGRNQKWYLYPVGNNQFKIISHHSGRGLDVLGGNMNNNAQVVQWDYLGGANQKWEFRPATVTGLENQVPTQQFSVYPNPADKILYIHASETSNGHVSVIDMAGNEVFSQTGDVSGINVSTLSAGLYAIKLNGGYTMRFAKK